MSYICKGKDGNIYDLKLLYIQRAYLPAITVCNQSLFKQIFVPNPPALPSVTNFVLESNGLVASFSWTPNATYTTYSEYKIDSGEWISLDDYAVNSDHSFFNFTGIATIGQSICIRLRFGNGTNYGFWNEECTVTNPFVLFYGNTLPDLVYIINGFVGPDPIASLSGNNVVIDHPEYLTGFIGQTSYDGQFDFTACSNITLVNSVDVNNGAKIYGCGNLTVLILSEVDASYIEDIDFTGCISLSQLSLQNCNITNIDFLDTIPNKLFLGIVNLSNNDITTADLTNFIYLEFLDIVNNANLSSLLVNSVSLIEIEAYSNTALTSLDLSSNLTYNVIALSSCNISTLTIANGTTNDGTTKTYYNISDNNLSTESLNAFFTALGEGTTFKKNKKKSVPTIHVDNNPGAELCDPTIATAKGWSVYTGFPLGTGIALYQQPASLLFDFSWTQNANYSTYSQYKINSGGIWTNIDTYAPNHMPVEYFNASSLMTVGDTFYLRLRFGDGVDYGSWDESSIITA